jgi:SAM-dependent methyltransferase
MNGRTPEAIRFDTVADIYDFYVQTQVDIPFWLVEAKAANGKVLELTSGTGRVSIPLLKAGIELTCVDYAPEMLDLLRKKLKRDNLSCPTILQDIAHLKLTHRFDMIFIPFHSFSELVQEDKRRSALVGIRKHLTDHGVFICTLQNPNVRTASMDGTVRLLGEFSLPNDERLVVNSRLLFERSSQLANGVQLYDRYSSDGRRVDHRELQMCFYLFHKQQFESLASNVGFEVAALYGDYDREPYDEQSSPYMIWKLRKSATG